MARGQITVFIIVGIVLLAGFGLLTYFVNFSVEESLQTEAMPIMDTVSQEFEPVQDFVISCMRDTLYSGIKKISGQGGYLYPDLLGTWNSEKPYDSAGVMLGSQMVPYWTHSPISVQDGFYRELSVPELSGEDPFSFESQLESWVDNEMTDCLNNFVVFSSMYEISSGLHKSTVRIHDNYVEVGFEKNVVVKDNSGSTATMNNFLLEMETELYSLHQTAQEITHFQHNNRLFEGLLLEVLPLHQGLDSQRLPPYKHEEIGEPLYVSWDLFDVTQRIESILNQYIPLTRYYGNPDLPRTLYDGDYSDIVQSTYDRFIFPQENGEHYVRFDYFSFNPYVNLNGGQKRVSGEQFTMDFSALDLLDVGLTHTSVQTTYDISFPVLVTLDSPSGLYGDPLHFLFAMEGLINNNNAVILSTNSTSVAPSQRLSLTCDDRQHELHMNISVVDYATRDLIDAEVSWTIPGAATCFAGDTNSEQMNVKTPTATGMVLTLRSDGYLTQNYLVDMYENMTFGYLLTGSPDLVLPMYPEKEVNVSFVQRVLDKCVVARSTKDCQEKVGTDNYEECMGQSLGRLCTDGASSIGFAGTPFYEFDTEDSNTMSVEYYVGGLEMFDNNTNLVYSFDRLYDEFGGTPSRYGGTHNIFLTHEDSIATFYPGTYDVMVTAVQQFDEPYRFGAEERCGSTKKSGCSIMDGYNMSTLPLGIYETQITVTADDLYNSESVEFPVISLVIPEVQQVLLDSAQSGFNLKINNDSFYYNPAGYYTLSENQNTGSMYNVSLFIGEEFGILNEMNDLVALYPNSISPRWSNE